MSGNKMYTLQNEKWLSNTITLGNKGHMNAACSVVINYPLMINIHSFSKYVLNETIESGHRDMYLVFSPHCWTECVATSATCPVQAGSVANSTSRPADTSCRQKS